jgi:hypothetical protein
MSFPLRTVASRRTRNLLIVAAAPVLIWFSSLLFLSLFDPFGPNHGVWFERVFGHGGLLTLIVFFICVPLALLCLLVLPFSFLLDWRKWKKTSVQK